jgi:DNA-binding response OmpR family regulator
MNSLLIIEDEPGLRAATAEILRRAGYTVHTASDGQEGLQAALQLQPDLILCDVMMPVLDGFSVLERLQKENTNGMPVFIFLTAKAQHESMCYGLELGADEYVFKPFKSSVLISIVEEKLRQRKQQEQCSRSKTDQA